MFAIFNESNLMYPKKKIFKINANNSTETDDWLIMKFPQSNQTSLGS